MARRLALALLLAAAALSVLCVLSVGRAPRANVASSGPDAPSVRTAQPSVGAAQPSVGAAQPSVGAAQPSVGAAQPNVRPVQLRVDSARFDALLVDSAPRIIELRFADTTGRRLGNLGALRREVESQGLELVMGMNAGMFEPNYEPVGLFVEHGTERAPLNLRGGEGNFYSLSNGVFAMREDGQAFIAPSSTYAQSSRGVTFATQSGPLLLDRGLRDPRLLPNSPHRQLRNAVGIAGSSVVFVISRERVSFDELARALGDLGCTEGLYLDGSVSKMYAPLLGRYDEGGDFGPLVAVVSPR